MSSNSKGKLIIVSAPSGAGKTTIVKALMQHFGQLKFSISATSREKRGREVHGKDYYFLSKEAFADKIKNHEFIEWEQVYPGQYYGTLREEIEKKHAQGYSVIFDVDVVGGLNIKEKYGDKALSIFIQPPSKEALKARLQGRKTESQEKIDLRLAKAEQELSEAQKFDCVILNDELEKAIEEAKQKVQAFLEL